MLEPTAMKRSDEMLLALIRAAIGKADLAQLHESLASLTFEEWESIVDMAFNQGVTAISFDGFILSDSEALDSDEMETIRYGWFASTLQMEEKYKRYVKTISSYVQSISSAGIDTMLLKGYGLSLNYPIPEHRPMGDVDVYHFGKWREVDAIIAAKKIRIDYRHHHHSVFHIHGELFENHYDIVNRYAAREGAQVDDVLKALAPVGRRIVSVGGVQLSLPSPTFNGMFLLHHSAAHFAGDRITLRHLLDWALFVENDWESINWDYVIEQADRMGLLRFLSCLNALSVDSIGIDASKFPVLERDSHLENRILDEILHPGFQEDGSGFIFKLRRLQANMWKRRLIGTESFVPRMVRLAFSHLIPPAYKN